MSWRARLWPSWFGGNVAVATGARVAMSAARALAGVIVPIYLALVGFSALRLGVLFVVAGLSSALIATTVGFLADRVGRKAFLIGIPLLAAASGVAYALTLDPVVLFVGAAAGSFGRGGGAGGGMPGPYAPAEQALIAESVTPVHRSAAFGRLAFGSSVGALVGSVVVAVLIRGTPTRTEALATYRPAYLALAAFAFVAGMLGWWLHDTGPRRPRQGADGRDERGPLLPRGSAPILYRLWVTNGLNGAAVGMFGPFVSYWFFRRFGVSAGTIGALYAVINAVAMAGNLSAAGFARRWGIVRATTGFRVAQALLLVPMVLAPAFLIAGGLYLVRMVAQRVALPLRQSYVMGVADPAERARVAALSTLPAQGAMSGSPALAGELFDHVALAAPFLVGGALQLANAVLFYVFFRHRPPEEETGGPGPGSGVAAGGVERRPHPGGDAGLRPQPGGDAGLRPQPGGDAGLRPQPGGDAGLRPPAGGGRVPGS